MTTQLLLQPKLEGKLELHPLNSENIKIETEKAKIKVEVEDHKYNLKESPPHHSLCVNEDGDNMLPPFYGTRGSSWSTQQIFPCRVCDHIFTSPDALQGHAEIHKIKRKRFVCDFCDYRSNVNYRLKIHMRNHTGEKPFQCDMCGRKFTCKNVLVRHVQIHTVDKPFKCPKCMYSCTRNYHLTRHTKLVHATHKAQRGKFTVKRQQLNCTVCDHKCRGQHNLKIHQRIHTGEKPFECAHCAYKCADKSSLRRHLKVHLGLKPFQCKICEYKSGEKNKLRRHLKTHIRMKQKPFPCELCTFRSTSKKSLSVHKSRSHRGKTLPSV